MSELMQTLNINFTLGHFFKFSSVTVVTERFEGPEEALQAVDDIAHWLRTDACFDASQHSLEVLEELLYEHEYRGHIHHDEEMMEKRQSGSLEVRRTSSVLVTHDYVREHKFTEFIYTPCGPRTPEQLRRICLGPKEPGKRDNLSAQFWARRIKSH